jgi:hypothetical protein
MGVISNGTTILDNGSLSVGTGKVLQVQSTTKTNTYTSNSGNTWVDITGMSVSITPESTSNKVLIQISLMGSGVVGANVANFRLLRGATVIYQGDTDGSRGRGWAASMASEQYSQESQSGTFLDSPSTTSATTYKIQQKSNNTIYVNRAETAQNDAGNIRTASTITAMEIAG